LRRTPILNRPVSGGQVKALSESPSELCLRCRKTVHFDLDPDELMCPECGWSKKAAARYVSELDRERRSSRMRRVLWVAGAVLAIGGMIAWPGGREAGLRGAGSAIGLALIAGVLQLGVWIARSIWQRWQAPDKSRRADAAGTFCPACGHPCESANYRPDANQWRCSACNAPLAKSDQPSLAK
jgi:ribosomal protein L37AE/L43A